jgi:hypothetical protein
VVHEAQDEQVLPAGQVVVHRRVLAGQADQLAGPAGFAGHVVPGHDGGARVGFRQGGEDADGGGLASPVRSEKGAYGAAGDAQAQPVQGLDSARGLAGAERLAQAGGLDRCGGRHLISVLSTSYMVLS